MKTIELLFKVCADSPESFTVTALERFFDECLSANIRLSTAKKYVESLTNLNAYTKNAIERTYNLFIEDELIEENKEAKNIFDELINDSINFGNNLVCNMGKIAQDLSVIPLRDSYRVVGDRIDARVKEDCYIYDVTGKGSRNYRQDIIEAVSNYLKVKKYA